MKTLNFDYEHTCKISIKDLNIHVTQLAPEIDRIIAARNTNYITDYASVNLPFDEELLTKIYATVKTTKNLHPTTLIVIGIGGSNLGTIAVLEALRGKFYNEYHETKIYFVDTVDSDNVTDIAHLCEHELSTGNNVLVNVISKSGTTTETIANFEIFLAILKNHRPVTYHQSIVIITDTDSALWHLAIEEQFTLLGIPQSVGGRYSVFSAVGLFPLCFLDIDIKKLCEGARSGFEISTSTSYTNNYAAISANLIALHYKHGHIIHDTFLFSVALESVGAWYRQLSAESLGKARDRNNNIINISLLPTVSIGSTDLHSIAQLYLASKDNRFTTFVSIARNASNITLPNIQAFEQLVPLIQHKSLSTIMDAILQGTKTAYLEDKRPFISWTIPEKSAFYIGQFMQIKMIEVMYLGYLLNVNPFDQPEVEKYKKETKKILATTHFFKN